MEHAWGWVPRAGWAAGTACRALGQRSPWPACGNPEPQVALEAAREGSVVGRQTLDPGLRVAGTPVCVKARRDTQGSTGRLRCRSHCEEAKLLLGSELA